LWQQSGLGHKYLFHSHCLCSSCGPSHGILVTAVTNDLPPEFVGPGPFVGNRTDRSAFHSETGDFTCPVLRIFGDRRISAFACR
jgi:hypothetical protein